MAIPEIEEEVLELAGRNGRDPNTLEFPNPTNLGKEEIEKLAHSVAKQLNYQTGDEIRPIIEGQLGGLIEHVDVDRWLEEGCDSIEVWGPRDFTIYLSKVAGMLRNRFKIAHALGHYVLHAQLGHAPLRVADVDKEDRVEWEATWFAACLLMPREEFLEALRKDSSDDYLAARFLVSPNAARVRKKCLGIR